MNADAEQVSFDDIAFTKNRIVIEVIDLIESPIDDVARGKNQVDADRGNHAGESDRTYLLESRCPIDGSGFIEFLGNRSYRGKVDNRGPSRFFPDIANNHNT